MQQRVNIQFYLVGPEPRKCRNLDIQLNDDIKNVKKTVGQEFHVVDPSGKSCTILSNPADV